MPPTNPKFQILYDALVPKLKGMLTFLGNLDYKKDFYKHVPDGHSSFKYHDKNGKAILFNIIRQVAPAGMGGMGTQVCATGNFNKGNLTQPRVITDYTTVKDLLFENQFIPMNQMVTDDNGDDFKIGKTPLSPPSECTVGNDLIAVHFLLLPSTSEVKNDEKQNLTRKNIDDCEDGNSNSANRVINNAGSVPAHDENIVTLGETYDPSHLLDYYPIYFCLNQNKLIQHDLRDIDGTLIPAWKNAEYLHKGMLVLWLSYYQLNAHKVKVLTKSSLMKNEVDKPNMLGENEATNGMDDFQNFSMGAKQIDHEKKEANIVDSEGHHKELSWGLNGPAKKKDKKGGNNDKGASENMDIAN
ncbi:hypothetical protein CPB84DRAFT_1846787 [Gymnopilus junonius]|uniref:Uncharacterized protein n=1 Tax=Gymnopilus junonius TaxID=109634 RepID=A0A9P5TNG9_GYMJU|nr:hypothetical protein CPB84DRAFT_1846787 [Gymnopilus junonius]